MMALFVVAALTATLITYRYIHSHFQMLSYMVALAVVGYVSLFFLLDIHIQTLICRILENSFHFILFILFILVSSVYNVLDLDLQTGTVIRAFGYIGIGLIAYVLFPAVIIRFRLFGHFFALLAITGVVSSAIGLFVALTGAANFMGLSIRVVQPFTPLGIYTTGSIFYNANQFGMVAFLGYLASLYFFMKKRHRSAALISAALCCLGVFVSWSRMVYISVLLSVVVMAYVGADVSQRARRIALLFLLTGCGIAALVLSQTLYGSLFGHGWSGRDVLWLATVYSIMERPWSGYGMGSSEILRNFLPSAFRQHSSPHSSILGFAGQCGIPAAMVYIAVVFISLAKLRRSRFESTTKKIVAAAAVGMFVGWIFLDYNIGGVSYGAFVFTTLLGLINTSAYLGQSIPIQSDGVFRDACLLHNYNAQPKI